MKDPVVSFTALQLLNVILSTTKSILTVKGSKTVAVLVNSFYYAFYTFVITAISSGDNSIYIIALVTFGTNLVGVWIALTFLEKLKKDQLYKISTTVNQKHFTEYKKELLNSNIYFIHYSTPWNEIEVIDIFSKNKNESKLIKEIIKKYDIKYNISVSKIQL